VISDSARALIGVIVSILMLIIAVIKLVRRSDEKEVEDQPVLANSLERI
jgi:hypothetical protein